MSRWGASMLTICQCMSIFTIRFLVLSVMFTNGVNIMKKNQFILLYKGYILPFIL